MFAGKPGSGAAARPAPRKCDPEFSLDAAAVIGGQVVFFKDRCVQRSSASVAPTRTFLQLADLRLLQDRVGGDGRDAAGGGDDGGPQHCTSIQRRCSRRRCL